MATADKSALQARIRDLLERDDPAAGSELRTLIEPRRMPGGRTAFVLRGSNRDIRRIAAEDYVGARDLMDRKRPAKRRKYLSKKNDPRYKGPRILVDGDSWFEYPCAKDVIEWLNDEFAILSLARAGDTWADIINQEGKYYWQDRSPMGLVENIRIEKPHIVMLSVGGNEIAGDIEKFVERYTATRPRDQYINADFDLMLNYLQHQYTTITRLVIAAGAKVIIHTYDYPDPRPGSDGGQWIGGPLEDFRNIGDHTLWRQIVNMMLDRFAARLHALANASSGNIHLVKVFGTIGTPDYQHGPDRNMWWDEMHGTDEGFEKVARKIREAIVAMWP